MITTASTDSTKVRIDNLTRVMQTLGSWAELARRIDKHPSQISDMVRGKKSFGSRVARDIESKLGLPRLSLDDPAAELQVVGLVRTTTSRNIPMWTLTDINALLNARTSPSEASDTITVGAECPETVFGVRLTNDSMAPKFEAGDELIFDYSRRPKAGSFVIGVSENLPEAVFRQYVVTAIDESGQEIYELRPLNNVYPTLSSKTNQLTICGVLIERREKFS